MNNISKQIKIARIKSRKKQSKKKGSTKENDIYKKKII